MKLLEYEAKELLKQAKIVVPHFSVLHQDSTVELPFPLVLKSQVPTGGRGKAGGILIIDTHEALQPAIDSLYSLDIKGFLPSTLLAEEKLSIKKEYYLSLTLERSTQSLVFIANTRGGVEVEENEPESFLRLPADERPDFDVIGQQLADYFQLAGQTFVLQDIAENLFACLVKNDALLIEINPLVLTTENILVAGDCKMILDDSASFRHEWNFEEKPSESNFVTLDEQGNIATIANGAGLAMATVDAAHHYNLTPANFLDIGGGANTEILLRAFNRLVEYPNIKAIVINIFAGITRCDEVAKAIVAAKSQIDILPPLFIRLAGTGYDQAVVIMNEASIPLLPSLEECLEAAAKEVHNG